MNDWFFSTARGVVGNCRQLAQITVGNRRQPSPQKFFPAQVNGERWKIFFRGGKAFSTFRRLSAAGKLSTIKFPRALRGSELEDEK